MEVGIVGLPGVGKTTLFNALTGSQADGYGDRALVGIASIPDPRLQTIAGFIATKKILPATLKLVDIPGVPPGGDAKKLNAVLEQIRQVDAIAHVLRAFDDGTGHIDPAADLVAMETELALADFVVAEGAKDKATRTARSGDKESKERLVLLERVIAILEDDKQIRSETNWSEADRNRLRSYGFITARPVLFVINVAEADLDGSAPAVAAARTAIEAADAQHVTLCAKLESELAELDGDDHDEMLTSLGLAEPAIGPLARAAHQALGLTTFYTAGDKEVRAWTIPFGANAPQAAGAIHSDIERGFIRAQCYHVDELVEHKTEKAIREAGRLRSEGKQYTMQDGDVVHFLFNV